LAEEFKAKQESRFPNDERIIGKLLATMPEVDSPRVLDIGPGNGNMSRILVDRGCEVTAIEISPEMARVTSERCPEAEMVVDDFGKHAFSEQYDGILAVAFVHLFPSIELPGVLRKVRDLLTNDGAAFISTTKHEKSSEGFERKRNFQGPSERFRRRFTQTELQDALEKNGLDVVGYSEDPDGEEDGKVWMNFIVRKGDG
jgi:cyclopropane fatty-acyl-phospholipid synthase-like methyltransferase